MKDCLGCGRTVDNDHFYSKGQRPSRRCKDCDRATAKRNRLANPERYAAYDRAKYEREPARHYAGNEKARRKYPERARARGCVARAVRAGRLKRQPCEVCGTVRAQAHHEDYSRPLDVRWLCAKHHMQIHAGAA